jgi:peptide deformylase
MAILKIAKLGHPILRKTAEPYSKQEIGLPQTQKLVEDMIETMLDHEGIGLAAPQIHISKQLFVAEVPPIERLPKLNPMPLTVFFNPKFDFEGEEKINMWEGCLSVPGLRGLVPRYKNLTLTYLDLKGKEKRCKASGFIAGVLQHEADHIFGKVFLDRMTSMEHLYFTEEWSKHPPDISDYDEGHIKFL